MSVETLALSHIPRMAALYLVFVFGGLALGSLVMWRGVERYDRRAPLTDAFGRELSAQPVTLAVPLTASALLCFGGVGYLLARFTSFGPAGVALLSSLAALAGMATTLTLVSRWAVPAAARSPEDPRFSLQGVPGRVLADIDEDDHGQISYEANHQSVTMRARSIDGSRIPAGNEVAIDRLEEGVAYVELWARVEERL